MDVIALAAFEDVMSGGTGVILWAARQVVGSIRVSPAITSSMAITGVDLVRFAGASCLVSP